MMVSSIVSFTASLRIDKFDHCYSQNNSTWQPWQRCVLFEIWKFVCKRKNHCLDLSRKIHAEAFWWKISQAKMFILSDWTSYFLKYMINDSFHKHLCTVVINVRQNASVVTYTDVNCTFWARHSNSQREVLWDKFSKDEN